MTCCRFSNGRLAFENGIEKRGLTGKRIYNYNELTCGFHRIKDFTSNNDKFNFSEERTLAGRPGNISLLASS